MYASARSTSRARLYLDKLSVPSFAAFSLQYKLYAAYGGPAFRVRRSSDNAELDIYFRRDNVADTAALLAFCSGTSGFLVQWYDQWITGRNVFRTSDTTQQPRLVNAGALEVNGSGKFAMRFDGSNDSLARGDNFGFTGTPALSILWAEESLGARYSWFMGANGVGSNYYAYQDPGSTQIEIGQGGSARGFNYTPTTGSHHFIVDKALSATISASNCEADGVALVQEALVAGANVMNLSNTSFHLGDTANGGQAHSMLMSCWVGFNSVISGADRTAARAIGALHA